MDCHSLLQGIFLTQGSTPHLLHWQVGSLLLSHQGTPFTFPNFYDSQVFKITSLQLLRQEGESVKKRTKVSSSLPSWLLDSHFPPLFLIFFQLTWVIRLKGPLRDSFVHLSAIKLNRGSRNHGSNCLGGKSYRVNLILSSSQRSVGANSEWNEASSLRNHIWANKTPDSSTSFPQIPSLHAASQISITTF